MARVRPKKWSEFQHYKDRDPTWIKLHKRLLDDYEFQSLPLASMALAPMFWLLASENKEGWIEYDIKKIAFRLRRTPQEIEDAIKGLISSGFFELEQSASIVLADVKRDATPENKRQVTSKTQEEAEEIARSACADEIAEALSVYNLVAEETDWPKAQAITPKRRSAIRARLADAGGLEGWKAAMARARASPFLRGESGRDRCHEKWTPDLDFFLQQSSFVKLMEGKYDDRTPAANDRNSDFLRGVHNAVSGYR